MAKKINFNLLDTKITIKFVDKIEDEDGVYFGRTQYDLTNAEVLIATKDSKGNQLSEDTIKTTILHELMHIILDKMYFRDESKNESLVEWCAQALNDLNKQGLYKIWEK